MAAQASRRRAWLWPTPELLGAGIFAVAVAVAVSKAPALQREILGLIYFGVMALIAAHDARTRRAPNRLVYPALALAVVASVAMGGEDTAEALAGGLVAFLVMLLVAAAGRGAMGAGDVKVGCLCGIIVGLHGVVPLLLVTFVVGAAVAGPLLALRLRRRGDVIAFTPFLVVATLFSTAYYHLYLWG